MAKQTSRGNDMTFLLISAFLVFGFNNTVTAAMPAYIEAQGGSALFGALQNSLFIATAIVLRFFLGPLSDKIGSRAMQFIGALAFCIPCAAIPLCDSYWQIVFLRIVQAIGLAAYHPNASAAVAEVAPSKRCGTWIGILRCTTTLSLLAGPVVLFPLIASSGYSVFFIICSAVACAGALAVLPTKPFDSHRRKDKVRPKRHVTSNDRMALERFWPFLAFPFVVGGSFGIVINFGSQIPFGTEPWSSGAIFAFISIGGLLGSLIAGRTCDTFGVGRTVFVCIVGVGIGFAGLASPSTSMVLPAASAFVIGAGYYGSTAAMTACLGAEAGSSRGYALSMQQNCLDTGIACGGLAGGAFLGAGLGIAGLCIVCSVILEVCGLSWMMLAGRKRRGLWKQ